MIFVFVAATVAIILLDLGLCRCPEARVAAEPTAQWVAPTPPPVLQMQLGPQTQLSPRSEMSTFFKS